MSHFGGWTMDSTAFQSGDQSRQAFDYPADEDDSLNESGFGPTELERTSYYETPAVVATPYQSHRGYGLVAYGFDGLLFDDIEEFFSNFGRISAKGVPRRGNWIYIWYEREDDFVRALGADGHFFENRTMIGVFPVPQDKPIEPGTLVYTLPVLSERAADEFTSEYNPDEDAETGHSSA